MGKVFFTSDTHFGQERTFNLSMRTMYFKDLEEMDNEMIRRWNETVSEDDTVFHLGDFGNYEVAKKLNGKIVLLYGNYERTEHLAPTAKQIKYFHKVYDKKHMVFNNDKDIIDLESFIVVHEPENKRGLEGFYLFGHIHEKQKVKKDGLNVGVDVHNFTPVSEITIEFYRNAIQNVYDNNCFINY